MCFVSVTKVDVHLVGLICSLSSRIPQLIIKYIPHFLVETISFCTCTGKDIFIPYTTLNIPPGF